MGRSTSSSYHLKRFEARAYQVSPMARYGVPSAYSSAWPLAEGLTIPRRSGFSSSSAAVHGTAANEPDLPEIPGSSGTDPLAHVQVPGAVASSRTRNVRPPSQKP